MNSINKIDEVLRLIICFDNSPGARMGNPLGYSKIEIGNDVLLGKYNISEIELIEILDKLVKDGHANTRIRPADNELVYYSSFEGRLFLLDGGYKSRYKAQKMKIIADRFITTINIINILAIIFLTFLIYK